MRGVFLLCLLLGSFASRLQAQDLNDWRGTWVSGKGAAVQVLYLVAHNNQLTGTLCQDCSNPDSLGLVDDAGFAAQTLHFTVFYSAQDKPAVAQKVTATLRDNRLHLMLVSSSGSSALEMQRPPPAPNAPAVRNVGNTPVTAPPAYVPPAAAETLTPALVAGLWLSGTGPGKQYFIFKPHKGGLRGLVCGPCDNPASFAPLEPVRLEGTRMHFDIVHEDNGFGWQDHGPFRNITTAQVVRNELHLWTVASFDPGATPYEMTLLGPVSPMPLSP